MFNSILIVPRGGDPAQPAMRRARDVAAPGTKLRVFDVVYEALIDGYMGNREIYEPLRSRVLRERQERADTLAKALEQRGVPSSAKVVWDHPIDEAVAREIAREQADLVVTAPLAAQTARLSHSDWRDRRAARRAAGNGRARRGGPHRMGALARGRIQDFLIGSTAERLLQHAHVDVLTVHPPAAKERTRE